MPAIPTSPAPQTFTPKSPATFLLILTLLLGATLLTTLLITYTCARRRARLAQGTRVFGPATALEPPPMRLASPPPALLVTTPGGRTERWKEQYGGGLRPGVGPEGEVVGACPGRRPRASEGREVRRSASPRRGSGSEGEVRGRGPRGMTGGTARRLFRARD
ncbi:hypothetical protein EJ06DRAFT_559493 [Trichodelitschia bisporula]|uniref:Uncharacterized protein n=1 Tax=Trichodelitschia bisporula TaxID=703511 RepID=A0A6G1HLB5_9PEZI|nr:hypothetical protein EJ06DRAFT_559493 [Trichodelitschia bisporula]